jgi:hypothetical protein
MDLMGARSSRVRHPARRPTCSTPCASRGEGQVETAGEGGEDGRGVPLRSLLRSPVRVRRARIPLSLAVVDVVVGAVPARAAALPARAAALARVAGHARAVGSHRHRRRRGEVALLLLRPMAVAPVRPVLLRARGAAARAAVAVARVPVAAVVAVRPRRWKKALDYWGGSEERKG